jgi:hypothetical protein
MHLQIRGHFPLKSVQELDEFLPPVTRQTASEDLPVQDVKCCKKRGRPLPLVVVRLSFGQSRTQR